MYVSSVIIYSLFQVCDPVVKVMNENESYNRKLNPNPKAKMERDNRNRVLNMDDDKTARFMSSAFVIAVEAILVAIILHWVLSPPFEISQLTNICASYEAYSGHFDLAGLTDICARKLELTTRSLTIPFLIFITIRIGAVFLLNYLPEQIRAFH